MIIRFLNKVLNHNTYRVVVFEDDMCYIEDLSKKETTINIKNAICGEVINNNGHIIPLDNLNDVISHMLKCNEILLKSDQGCIGWVEDRYKSFKLYRFYKR